MTHISIKVKQYTPDISLKLAKNKEDNKFADYQSLMDFDVARRPWRETLARSFKTDKELAKVFNNINRVDDEVYKVIATRITPYIAQLMDKDDQACPIRIQYVPEQNEMDVAPQEMGDQLGEDNMMPEGTSIVHRYPNRVLFLVHNICGAYCRHCTRKRMVSDPLNIISMDRIRNSVEYLRQHSEVQDVLLSGGDPLLLTDDKLDQILSMIREARPDLKILRIGSRLPAQLPTRITPELCQVLVKNRVTLLNTQINHPKEITPLFVEHMALLRNSGIMLGNQSVLIKGVNDSVEVMRDLVMELISNGIRPYYVYSMDPAPGNSKFQVSYDRMLEIYHGIRGWVSGPAIPTFIVDGIGGLGKMPVQPEYVRKQEIDGETKLIATNFEGRSVDMTFLLSQLPPPKGPGL
ncbi:KamA family radical SAM protein [Psychromonas sp. MB-3u-54]|uniref:KamA family radical SAM protein n=1 Tax=Psychromonas sp. MB-3u-54 TaxID=2058319 RepID=UPI000C328907|nr:KamA family radical SAM protein [Psychromonas sp. MB-3u-54]PKH03849.1 KamA family radical SAM protein [Psychromonas sp. MB-3u-54]